VSSPWRSCRVSAGRSGRLARPLAVAGIAALAVVFGIMWVRRPIWGYPTRILAAHGFLPAGGLRGLVSSRHPSRSCSSSSTRRSSSPCRSLAVGGCLFIGAVTGLAGLAGSGGALETALPSVFSSLLTAGMVVAIGVWMRQTIAPSLGRRALIAELTAAREELAAAEREAAVAEERARLAREIHDTLAQGFASVVTHLEAADACLGTDEGRARRDLRTAAEVARASLAEARTVLWALRPETIATAGLPARDRAGGGGRRRRGWPGCRGDGLRRRGRSTPRSRSRSCGRRRRRWPTPDAMPRPRTSR